MTATIDDICRQIEELGPGTPEYHDATAFLLTIMAKRQWIIADSIRRSRRDREARQERARLKKEAKA